MRHALAAILLAACSSSVTEEPPACLRDDRDACQACLDAASAPGGACVSTIAACGEVATCSPFAVCYQSRADLSDACEAQHPGGREAWAAVIDCNCSQCAAVCCDSCSDSWGLL